MIYFNKKTIMMLFGLLISALLFTVWHGTKITSNKENNTAIQPHLVERFNLTAFTDSNSPEEYLAKINEEEKTIWQEIEQAIGITKEQFIAMKHEDEQRKIYDNDIQNLIEKRHSDTAVSQENIQFIHEMFNMCGIDAEKINIKSSNGFSPAAATDTTLLINEEKFSSLAPAMKKFVLVHEISHIINQDHSTICMLDDLKAEQKDTNQLENLLSQIKYLSEVKADVFAILHGQEFAEGQIDFMEQCMKLYGNKPGHSHPSSGERREMGQKLLAMMEQTRHERAL